MFDRVVMLATLSERLHECSDDELRVIDRVLQGIEQGRDAYGPLVVLRDSRNWRAEGAMELRDFLFYACAHEVARDARERERIASAEKVMSGLRELRAIEVVEFCVCGHLAASHADQRAGCSEIDCTCLSYWAYRGPM